MKDLKYVSAFVVPLMAALALAWQGPWMWLSPVLIFGLVPLLEQVLPRSTANFSEAEEATQVARPIFDWMLYANVPIVLGMALWCAHVAATMPLSSAEWVGMVLTVGMVMGSNGINVAHELGHRNTVFEQILAKTLLLPALYQHFFVEHNRGHHKHVATDDDPASARLGQSVYGFWVQSVVGGWRSAWQIEMSDLAQKNRSMWSLHNQLLRFVAMQAAWLGGIAWVWGVRGLLAAVAVAVVGILLLETINYIEHYGLRRRRLESGRYEPVMPAHSWNSDHEIGRILLYELTRHSDHHYKSTRKYQILRHLDQSPQLPAGYPASMLLSLVPPLWFGLMDRRVADFGQSIAAA
jgi:alkane 1-monooxygenase